jgi:hypothetical protein
VVAEEFSEDQVVDRRMALAREWDELVEQVQAIEGFEDFLRPPKIEQLLPAAAGGPVVIVNVSRWRCDALIVELDGVRAVKLRQLTLDETARRASNYLEVLHAAEVALGELVKAEHEMSTASSRPLIVRYRRAKQQLDAAMVAVDEMLTDLQVWMWDVIADPVLTALGRTEKPAGESATWPRVWWCPTGALTILPLHTAGHHANTGDSPPRTVLDRVVSSYTPTLRALLDARTRPGQDVEDRMLLVSAGNVDGQVPLETEAERALLHELFPHSLTDLPDKKATRDVVRLELAKHRWAHFTCHGDQNLLDPSSGGLWLSDGKLSIADLSAERFHGDFAGLSACKTAIGGIDLLDEAITLAAAFHYMGYRHVVATLWSVEQQAAEEVFGSVYQQIVTDEVLRPELAAVALHDAVRALREKCLESPQIWTPFTHTGP